MAVIKRRDFLKLETVAAVAPALGVKASPSAGTLPDWANAQIDEAAARAHFGARRLAAALESGSKLPHSTNRSQLIVHLPASALDRLCFASNTRSTRIPH